jgi:hypothetical protein
LQKYIKRLHFPPIFCLSVSTNYCFIIQGGGAHGRREEDKVREGEGCGPSESQGEGQIERQNDWAQKVVFAEDAVQVGGQDQNAGQTRDAGQASDAGQSPVQARSQDQNAGQARDAG